MKEREDGRGPRGVGPPRLHVSMHPCESSERILHACTLVKEHTHALTQGGQLALILATLNGMCMHA